MILSLNLELTVPHHPSEVRARQLKVRDGLKTVKSDFSATSTNNSNISL